MNSTLRPEARLNRPMVATSSCITSFPLNSFFFFLMMRRPPSSTLFPYPPLFRSRARGLRRLGAVLGDAARHLGEALGRLEPARHFAFFRLHPLADDAGRLGHGVRYLAQRLCRPRDRKSTRLNSSHSQISYAVFCL